MAGEKCPFESLPHFDSLFVQVGIVGVIIARSHGYGSATGRGTVFLIHDRVITAKPQAKADVHQETRERYNALLFAAWKVK